MIDLYRIASLVLHLRSDCIANSSFNNVATMLEVIVGSHSKDYTRLSRILLDSSQESVFCHIKAAA